MLEKKEKNRKKSDTGIRWISQPGCTTEDCRTLLTHEESFSKDVKNELIDAVDGIKGIFPPECWISTSHAVSYLYRIQCNAHAIVHNGAYVALGLYPVASYLNHSCLPNTAPSFIGSTLTFRTLQPIKKGEQITYSYCDLFLPREERQKILSKSYFFECKCDRCTSNLDDSVDRFLISFDCQKCNKLIYKGQCECGEVIDRIKLEEEATSLLQKGMK